MDEIELPYTILQYPGQGGKLYPFKKYANGLEQRATEEEAKVYELYREEVLKRVQLEQKVNELEEQIAKRRR